MSISFACTCGKPLRARDDLAGRKTRCPDCAAILRIPASAIELMATPLILTSATTEDHEDDGNPYELAPPAPAALAVPPRPRDADHRPATGPGTAPVAGSTFQPARGGDAPIRESEAKPKRAASQRSNRSSPREYAHLAFGLALIPLVVSLLGTGGSEDLPTRFARSVAAAPAEDQGRIRSAMEAVGENVSLDRVIGLLPGGRLAGAHLSRDTTGHWAYAAIAAAGFLLLLGVMFSVERAVPWHLVGIGAFTGTVGIVFLLLVQLCSQFRLGLRSLRGGGVMIVVMLVLMFIGWSYGSAFDPDSSFLVSALGFTCGVGLCEEFTKAIPLFFAFRRFSEMGWRTACLWGLASGVGFGVSEGVMYSSRHDNGMADLETYLVRFISCVALHAMWSASVGIAIARNVDEYERVEDAAGTGLFMLRMMAVPMVLHGLYDTLLKKEMNLGALGIAVITFGWFAWHVEVARAARPGAGRPRAKRPVY